MMVSYSHGGRKKYVINTKGMAEEWDQMKAIRLGGVS